MTVDSDERRPDHTRPTIAFIALAVAAAAVMTAGMTADRPGSPMAADRPPLLTPEVPAADASPSPEPPAFPEFSMADVVTLAEVEPTPRPGRSKPRRDTGPGTGPTTPGPAPKSAGGTAGGDGSGSGDGARTSTGPRTGGSGAGGTTSGSAGSDGSSATGSTRTRDAGPGRSTRGQGKARGQRDTTPGRSGSAKKQGRR